MDFIIATTFGSWLKLNIKPALSGIYNLVVKTTAYFFFSHDSKAVAIKINTRYNSEF